MYVKDPLAHSFAAHADAVVVSVEYRLAPEHPYPAGVEDAYVALQWAADNAAALLRADASRLCVAGVSAGGLVAAVLAQLARDRRGPKLFGQVLMVPMLTPAMTASKLAFYDEHQGLSNKEIAWMWHMYIGSAPVDAHRCVADARCSPLAQTDLAGLPPAFVALGMRDILYAEGAEYVQRLRAAGVRVDVLEMRGSHFAMAFDGYRCARPQPSLMKAHHARAQKQPHRGRSGQDGTGLTHIFIL